ncbi:hypothetical protein [Rubrimonas cliftonensis]|uniref:Uncharacterized protein n=1 Tax=Rubrimonas cliftonensis TaxID=89524 RepID=A0A1H4CTK1_9RHOB|nr:hypothetical protein [Rubrimonas cliftonensis]SEA63661.1 hypothetical protein SAMN05444370_10824 [Rubrimonas cliftonensis]
MKHGPIKVLAAGYGLGVAAGAAVWTTGGSILASAATAWLGGAAATLALAAIPATRRLLADAGRGAAAEDERALAEAVRRWEDERLGVSAKAERRRFG